MCEITGLSSVHSYLPNSFFFHSSPNLPKKPTHWGLAESAEGVRTALRESQTFSNKLSSTQIVTRMLKIRLSWIPEWVWDFTERARVLLSHHYRSETSGGRWNCWALFSDSFLFQLFVFQDDHKLSLDELHRKYGTDLNRVGKHCIPSFFALIWKETATAQSISQREIWVVWFWYDGFFLFVLSLPSSS